MLHVIVDLDFVVLCILCFCTFSLLSVVLLCDAIDCLEGLSLRSLSLSLSLSLTSKYAWYVAIYEWLYPHH